MTDRYLTGLTPVEKHGDYWLKRDDLFMVNGASGGKARTCWALAHGAKGLVTAGSRSSPQINIVARIAAKLGIPCRAHTPEGELSFPLREAKDWFGCEIVQHKAGYNNVITERARSDAKASGWTEIPFGMECREAVLQTARQVDNLPDGPYRVVVPVGSGMSLAGVATGMGQRYGLNLRRPLCGVMVGADGRKRLTRWLPFGYRGANVTLLRSGLKYDTEAKVTKLAGVELDPIYEAKCIPFLQKGDLLWVVGIRSVEKTKAPF